MRLYTDLLLSGAVGGIKWNNGPWGPFGSDYDVWPETDCHLLFEFGEWEFHNHKGFDYTPTELTAKNYLSILKSIQ